MEAKEIRQAENKKIVDLLKRVSKEQRLYVLGVLEGLTLKASSEKGA